MGGEDAAAGKFDIRPLAVSTTQYAMLTAVGQSGQFLGKLPNPNMSLGILS
jgi:hypothetical protein